VIKNSLGFLKFENILQSHLNDYKPVKLERDLLFCKSIIIKSTFPIIISFLKVAIAFFKKIVFSEKLEMMTPHKLRLIFGQGVDIGLITIHQVLILHR
jgi:hypothetical protein